MRLMTTSAAIAATLLVTACAQQEEPEVVVVPETPIYGKDGTIIGTRPTVAPGDDFDSIEGN